MRKLILAGMLLFLFVVPVQSLEIQAPEAPDRVVDLIPKQADSFGEGLWNVIKGAIAQSNGPMHTAMRGCMGVISAVIMCTLLQKTSAGTSARTVNMACSVVVAGILLQPSDTMIRLGIETATELREYGNLLLPVMTGALAARGGMTSSAALYAGTAWFNGILTEFLTRFMRPMLYIFLALAVANSIWKEELLEKTGKLIQWMMTWALKIALYLFTGYITITGVISGTADAAAVRAAKVTLSTVVPVVGGMLSDASELVLVSAGTLGSAAGVYGILTVLALFAGPFIRIGIQYLMLKGVGIVCSAFSGSGTATLLENFSTAMGLTVAMISTQTLLLMISTVCFMKGVV